MRLWPRLSNKFARRIHTAFPTRDRHIVCGIYRTRNTESCRGQRARTSPNRQVPATAARWTQQRGESVDSANIGTGSPATRFSAFLARGLEGRPEEEEFTQSTWPRQSGASCGSCTGLQQLAGQFIEDSRLNHGKKNSERPIMDAPAHLTRRPDPLDRDRRFISQSSSTNARTAKQRSPGPCAK